MVETRNQPKKNYKETATASTQKYEDMTKEELVQEVVKLKEGKKSSDGKAGGFKVSAATSAVGAVLLLHFCKWLASNLGKVMGHDAALTAFMIENHHWFNQEDEPGLLQEDTAKNTIAILDALSGTHAGVRLWHNFCVDHETPMKGIIGPGGVAAVVHPQAGTEEGDQKVAGITQTVPVTPGLEGNEAGGQVKAEQTIEPDGVVSAVRPDGVASAVHPPAGTEEGDKKVAGVKRRAPVAVKLEGDEPEGKKRCKTEKN